jgi:hypothetical protein
MADRKKTKRTGQEKRKRGERRDPLLERRQKDRRQLAQRKGERRLAGRRADFCPTCGSVLTPTGYCPSCKVRVVKIRAAGGGR